MTPADAAARTAAGLAYVCAHLDDLQAILRGDGADPPVPLRQLLAAVRSGPQTPRVREQQPALADLLDAVHEAVQAAGDSWGVYGYYEQRGIGAVGIEPLEVVYRCPLRLCLGRGEDEITALPARCAISGQELRPERLD